MKEMVRPAIVCFAIKSKCSKATLDFDTATQGEPAPLKKPHLYFSCAIHARATLNKKGQMVQLQI